MVICLERGADLHMAQLMPLPLTGSCFGKIQICFTFLVPVHPGSPRQRAVKWLCVCYGKNKYFRIDLQVTTLTSTPQDSDQLYTYNVKSVLNQGEHFVDDNINNISRISKGRSRTDLPAQCL